MKVAVNCLREEIRDINSINKNPETPEMTEAGKSFFFAVAHVYTINPQKHVNEACRTKYICSKA